MRFIKTTLLPILLAAAWISFSEFFRNEILLKSLWIGHYASLGIVFPSAPINGMIWGVWSVVFAVSVFIIAKKFTTAQTVFVSWLIFFVPMWLVIGNLNVLPYGILPYAIPLSLLEAGIAAVIIKKLTGDKGTPSE